jgi:hypothetical protein
LAKKLTAKQLAAVTKIMSDQQLDMIPLGYDRASVVIEGENPRVLAFNYQYPGLPGR